MRDIGWRLKQWFRKLFPLALIGAFLYGGFNLYKAGAFRRGFGPAVTSALRHVPYFGSRFKNYSPGRSSRKSYSYQGKKRGGRHYRRAGRRHRRR